MKRRQVTRERLGRIIEMTNRVLGQMAEIKRKKPLVDIEWRFLKKGEYYDGRARTGNHIKIPNGQKLKLKFVNGGKRVNIGHKREQTRDLTKQDDGQPVQRENKWWDYDIFQAVRSRRHLLDGHVLEMEQIKKMLRILIIIHQSNFDDRKGLNALDLDHAKTQVASVLGDCEPWEAAYKIFGKFKLEDVPVLFDEAKEDLSRLSIAFVKIVSMMERVSKWRPRQVTDIDRYNYKREAVLRHRRDLVLKKMLVTVGQALDSAAKGANVEHTLAVLEREYELICRINEALDKLNDPKGGRDWEGIKENIVIVGQSIRDAPTLVRADKPELRGWLSYAWKLANEKHSKGRVPNIREALELSRWLLEIDSPRYWAAQLRETNDTYMLAKGTIQLIEEADDGIGVGNAKAASRMLVEASKKLPGKV